jgi:hypothetical protein
MKRISILMAIVAFVVCRPAVADDITRVLDNPSFDAAPGGKIAGWDHASGDGISVCLDAAEGHSSALHLVSKADGKQPAPVIWVRSNTFPAPKTAVLTMTVRVRVDDPNKQPMLRLAIEGKKDGKSFYRRANIGGSESGQTAIPIKKQWLPYRFRISDLPPEGITDLRVGFDLMGEGNVYIDDVSVESSRPELSLGHLISWLLRASAALLKFSSRP